MRSSSVVVVSGRSGTVGSLRATAAAPIRYSVIRRNQSCKDPLGVHISDNVPNPIPRTTDTVLDAVGVLVVLVLGKTGTVGTLTVGTRVTGVCGV